jgi:hypothetical protein
MQAKDISTEAFIAAVEQATATYRYANVMTVARILDAPYKVVAAKTTKLDRQGIIEGCGCGCGSPMWVKREAEG